MLHGVASDADSASSENANGAVGLAEVEAWQICTYSNHV